MEHILYINTENVDISNQVVSLYENDLTKKRIPFEKDNVYSKSKNKKNETMKKNIIIPKINEFEGFLNSKYTALELKQICRIYKLKVTGKKQELLNRIYIYLKQSFYSIKIQSIVKRFFIMNYFKLLNPLYSKSQDTKYVNDTDFLSLEELDTLDRFSFFSVSMHKLNYGFNYQSMYNLYVNEGSNLKNPYTREKFDDSVIQRIQKIHRYRLIFKKLYLTQSQNSSSNENSETNTIYGNLNETQIFKLECVSLFQKINEYGHYSDESWFLELDKYKLIKFITELKDIWCYRASIPNSTKIKIYPPFDIFEGFRVSNLMISDFVSIQKKSFHLIQRFVNSGVDEDSRKLGCIYVLGALTLVSESAAQTLPWLYETFHF